MTPNPVATKYLPFFITAPGETDLIYNVTLLVVIASIVLTGVIFLTIHSLPERMAHKSKKIQFDIVAVLCLLALLTHENVLWVAALLLAYIDIPDFSSPFRRIATAVETMAGQEGIAAGPADRAEPIPPKAASGNGPHMDQKGSVHA